MIFFTDTVDKECVNYVNQAIEILARINICINQTILFKEGKLKKNCFGTTSKDKDMYVIKLNNHLLKEKDQWINTIIHEIIHVLTDLKGANAGHGKEFNRIADYVTQNTKYIIVRYAYKNLPVTKHNNSFSNLDEFDQEMKLEIMTKNKDEELKLLFSSIYFTLKSEDLKNKLTVYYIECCYLTTNDNTAIVRHNFPYYAFNDKCRRIIANNYLNGKYDTLLDTIEKSYSFDSLFSLKEEYIKVSEYTNRRFSNYIM